jgi:hypothetical protein
MPGRSNSYHHRGTFVRGLNSEWNVRLNSSTSKYDLYRTKNHKFETDIPTRKLALEILNDKIAR